MKIVPPQTAAVSTSAMKMTIMILAQQNRGAGAGKAIEPPRLRHVRRRTSVVQSTPMTR
jgi:hypothetical protein